MYAILHEIITALFRIGGITDVRHDALHTAINEADPDFAAQAARAAVELSDVEQAELARLQAKQAAAAAEQATPAAPPVPSPGAGFNQVL